MEVIDKEWSPKYLFGKRNNIFLTKVCVCDFYVFFVFVFFNNVMIITDMKLQLTTLLHWPNGKNLATFIKLNRTGGEVLLCTCTKQPHSFTTGLTSFLHHKLPLQPLFTIPHPNPYIKTPTTSLTLAPHHNLQSQSSSETFPQDLIRTLSQTSPNLTLHVFHHNPDHTCHKMLTATSKT